MLSEEEEYLNTCSYKTIHLYNMSYINCLNFTWRKKSTQKEKKEKKRRWKLALPVAQRQTDRHNYEVLLFADLGGCISFLELSNQQIPEIVHRKTLNLIC